MYLDKKYFDSWMQRIMDRFDGIEKPKQAPMEPQPLLADGNKLLDNYDLCKMLNVNKRTLQRYRSLGDLPYEMIPKCPLGIYSVNELEIVVPERNVAPKYFPVRS